MLGKLRRIGVSEDGNITVLSIGVCVLVVMLVGFAAAVTGVELDRNRIQFVSDGAALYASSGFSEEQVYGDEAGSRGPTAADARARAQEYVKEYPISHPRIDGIRVEQVSVDSDGRVTLTVVGSAHPPLVGWVSRSLDKPVSIRVSSEAHTH